MHDHRYVRDTVKSPSPRHAAAITNRIGDAKSPSPRQNLPPNLTPLRNPISPWDSECALHLKKKSRGVYSGPCGYEIAYVAECVEAPTSATGSHEVQRRPA